MGKGLFNESEFASKTTDRPWMKSDTDKMLDDYFTGSHPDRIAQKLDRHPKAVKRRLEQYTYNEDGKAEAYDPIRRICRKGMRITENERLIIGEHIKRKVPPAATAKVLQRDVSEFFVVERKAGRTEQELRVFLPAGIGVDLCLAHRALKHFFHKPLVSDQELKGMEAEEKEMGGAKASALDLKPGKTVYDVPLRIRSLAIYLSAKHDEEKQGKEIF